METEKKFIDRVYELKGLIRYRILLTNEFLEKEEDSSDIDLLKEQLKILCSMLILIDDIIQKYYEYMCNEIELKSNNKNGK